MVERSPEKAGVAGSSPAFPTITKWLYALRICLRYAVADLRAAHRNTRKHWRLRWRIACRFYEVREQKRASGTSRGRSRGS